MKVFEFEEVVKQHFLRGFYHNNKISKFVDLSDFTDKVKFIEVITKLLRSSKLVRILEVATENVLKIYEKPILPKYFLEAIKLTDFDKLVIKRNDYYKIRHAEIAKILNISVKEVSEQFESNEMFYGNIPFYKVDKSTGTLLKYSFYATEELESIFEESICEQTVVESIDEISDAEISDDESDETKKFELRQFQLEELNLMLENDKYWFQNPPRVGTSYIIKTYVKRRPSERILILVSRKTLELKFKNLIKTPNVVVCLIKDFQNIEDKTFDTIICDECQNDYLATFQKSPINHRIVSFNAYSLKDNCKHFFFSSTMPNDVDFNKFYEYTYKKAIDDGFVVPVELNKLDLTTNIKKYLNETDSEHVLIVSENFAEFKNFATISSSDTTKQRLLKIQNLPQVLVSSTDLLEGLDLPECDEVILYKPQFRHTNAIQICGRCLEKTQSKKIAKITIFDKSQIQNVYQYFSPKSVFEKQKNSPVSVFQYDFISNFKICLSKIIKEINAMENYFDRSLINVSLKNFFTKSQSGREILKTLIVDKFGEKVNADNYVELMSYAGETREMSRELKNLVDKNTKKPKMNIELTYRINGFNYKTNIVISPKLLRSDAARSEARKMFYETYGTTDLEDDFLLMYGNLFYRWSNVNKTS